MLPIVIKDDCVFQKKTVERSSDISVFGLTDDSQILILSCALNILQCIVLVEECGENLTSERYLVGKGSYILITILDDCGVLL